MPRNDLWTKDNKKIARDLWMQGYSALYIGDKMGKTRPAIMGLMNRMGLLRVDRPANPSPHQIVPGQRNPNGQFTGRKPIKAILGHKRSDGTPINLKDIPMPDPSVAARTSYRQGGKIDLMELRWNSCRWPLGDPAQWDQFGYCGAQTEGGTCPYCVIHRKIAFYNPRASGGHFVVKART